MKTVRLDEWAAGRLGQPVDAVQRLIMAGNVLVDGVPQDKPGTMVSPDSVLTLREKKRAYASRSGYKLEKALGAFSLSPAGWTVCDIGASNGGFTDCLLQHGASRVFAVDVAYGILDWKLRQDERVTVLERTNARRLTVQMLGMACRMATADVSFISLKKIFPAIDQILTPEGDCVCLIKPQFEAPARLLGKNGILRDPSDLSPLLMALTETAAENRLFLAGLTISPIHGTNGAVEYLAHFRRTPTLGQNAVRAAIAAVAALRPDEDQKAGSLSSE